MVAPVFPVLLDNMTIDVENRTPKVTWSFNDKQGIIRIYSFPHPNGRGGVLTHRCPPPMDLLLNTNKVNLTLSMPTLELETMVRRCLMKVTMSV